MNCTNIHINNFIKNFNEKYNSNIKSIDVDKFLKLSRVVPLKDAKDDDLLIEESFFDVRVISFEDFVGCINY